MYGDVYGSGPRGADIYKNSRGFFYVDYDTIRGKEFKHYLPKYRPDPDAYVKRPTRKSSKPTKKRPTRRHRT